MNDVWAFTSEAFPTIRAAYKAAFYAGWSVGDRECTHPRDLPKRLVEVPTGGWRWENESPDRQASQERAVNAIFQYQAGAALGLDGRDMPPEHQHPAFVVGWGWGQACRKQWKLDREGIQ
jgi:hypothetical protein